jgi:hypothetical protein
VLLGGYQGVIRVIRVTRVTRVIRAIRVIRVIRVIRSENTKFLVKKSRSESQQSHPTRHSDLPPPPPCSTPTIGSSSSSSSRDAKIFDKKSHSTCAPCCVRVWTIAKTKNELFEAF